VIYVLLQNFTRDESMRSIREALRRNETDPERLRTELLIILLTVVTIAVGLLILAALQRAKKGRSVRSPNRLFGQLLRPLGLSVSERMLLRRVARKLKLHQPTLLRLSPHHYAQLAEQFVSVSPWDSTHGSLRVRLDGISRKLFGQPSSAANTDPSASHEPRPPGG
jgi:hypothetical protein